MKYIFWGGKAIGNSVLEGLIQNNHVPKGIIVYRDILDLGAIDKTILGKIEILNVHKFHSQQDEIIEFIRRLNVDFYISVAFPFILSKEILNLVKYPINIHTGAIPKYRGHHPLSAALLNDEPYQATTVHFMAEEVDAGEILIQDFVKVDNEDDIITIRQKLIELSLRLILTAIRQLHSGTLYPKCQIGEVVWAPKRTPEDSKIDFSRNSRYLHNFIRALVDPYPNAFAYRGKECVKFKKSHASNLPGHVLASLGERRYIVSTGDGVIMVDTDIDLQVGDKLE